MSLKAAGVTSRSDKRRSACPRRPRSPLQTCFVWNNSKEADAEGKDEAKLKGDYAAVPEGEYLVDDAGAVRYDDEPTQVKMKFEAPKTQVMGIIINGLLQRQPQLDADPDRRLHRRDDGVVRRLVAGVRGRRLHPDGVFDADLPGRPGPLGRGPLDDARTRRKAAAEAATAEERARAEVEAIAKTETSPGVLLASGLIAGGSLAGVTIAFLEFAPSVQERAGLLGSAQGHALRPQQRGVHRRAQLVERPGPGRCSAC